PPADDSKFISCNSSCAFFIFFCIFCICFIMLPILPIPFIGNSSLIFFKNFVVIIHLYIKCTVTLFWFPFSPVNEECSSIAAEKVLALHGERFSLLTSKK